MVKIANPTAEVEMIKVKSADGELVEIHPEAARRSNVVKDILEGEQNQRNEALEASTFLCAAAAPSDQSQIPLPIAAHLLKMVFHKYCGHYAGREIPAIKQPLEAAHHIGEVSHHDAHTPRMRVNE